MAFLRSGLSLERAIAVNVSNQQSLRFPFWRLPPLVERANGLEILTVLPEAGTLSSSEIVAYVAASNDSQNLSAT
ncbi:MAG: hypothetical protein Q4A13_05630, partial [Fretibacterium sp.]|nr:hypothetical protein [Fretibacterium sp.]